MRTLLIASLRTHARRYVAALVAVATAVGFVVVTNALASSTKSGLSASVESAYPGADLVVGETYGVDAASIESAQRIAEQRGDATTVVALGYLPVAHDGQSLGSDVSVGTVSTDDELRRQQIESGRAPRSDSEALVDAGTAEASGVKVGDTLTLSPGTREVEVTVVGLASGTSYLSADVYATWPALSQVPGAGADSLVYDARNNSVDTALSTLDRDVETRVIAAADYVDERVKIQNQGVDIVSYLLLLFATVAGFVSALVIANTFTILFAQRTRELALLRCIGATSAEVRRSVRRESAVIAVAASLVGVVGGALLGHLAARVVRAFAGPEYVGPVSLSPAWIVSAFVGGVVVTMIAAWLPTRAVTKVTPLAAMQPGGDVQLGTSAGRVRLALSAVAAVVGCAALAVAVLEHQVAAMLAGGVLVFGSVLLTGPILVPRLLRWAGAALSWTGMSTRIATANAVRNPRRTATTTASLLIGVTLATSMLTGLASARGAVDGLMDHDHPIDLTLVSDTDVPAGAREDVEATRGVESVAALSGGKATITGLGEVVALSPPDAATALSSDRGAVTPQPGEVLIPVEVSASRDATLPDEVQVTIGDRTVTLEPRVVGSEWGDAVLVAPQTLDELGVSDATHALWVEAESGYDAETIGGELGAVARSHSLDLSNELEDRAYVDLQLDIAVWAVLGLLGISIAIALVGIANTVGLSVMERGREHALLRALGLTRGQLRRVLAAEGLLLAGVAALMGAVVGTTFGWIGTETMVQVAVEDAPVVLPWGQLVVVVVAAAAAGLLACVLPARRAARVTPAAGLTLE